MSQLLVLCLSCAFAPPPCVVFPGALHARARDGRVATCGVGGDARARVAAHVRGCGRRSLDLSCHTRRRPPPPPMPRVAGAVVRRATRVMPRRCVICTARWVGWRGRWGGTCQPTAAGGAAWGATATGAWRDCACRARSHARASVIWLPFLPSVLRRARVSMISPAYMCTRAACDGGGPEISARMVCGARCRPASRRSRRCGKCECAAAAGPGIHCTTRRRFCCYSIFAACAKPIRCTLAQSPSYARVVSLYSMHSMHFVNRGECSFAI